VKALVVTSSDCHVGGVGCRGWEFTRGAYLNDQGAAPSGSSLNRGLAPFGGPNRDRFQRKNVGLREFVGATDASYDAARATDEPLRCL
jgi:hypothetical protein